MRKRFVSGLVLLLPVTITLWFIKLFLSFLTTPFQKSTACIFKKIGLFSEGFWVFSLEETIQFLSFFFIILFLLFLFFLVGYLALKCISSPLFKYIDQFLLSLPLVNSIYRNCKEVTRVLFAPTPDLQFQVAYIPFPDPSKKALSLIIHKVLFKKDPTKPKPYVLALLPASPNPTVGFLVFLPEEEVVYAPNIMPDEALRLILSCGSMSKKTEEKPS